MTVLEYFDYEKQLLRDYDAVKTPHAKAAVFETLMDTLDTHKKFVFNTIASFEENLKNARADLQKAQNGETPTYVKDMMAEFGFYEPEEAGYESTQDYIASTADVNKTIDDWTKVGSSAAEKKPEKKRRSRRKKDKAEKAEKEPQA